MPLGAGVPVRITMSRIFGSIRRRALNRFDAGFLKDDDSSTTTMSKGQHMDQFSTSHTTFSRLMIVTSAPLSMVAARSCAVPSAVARVSRLR